jgi:hypothetical protein
MLFGYLAIKNISDVKLVVVRNLGCGANVVAKE